VGGEDIFDPLPIIKDLGLLSYHLLASRQNVHYFVGDDFNIYEYFGGSVKRAIGDKIHKNLQDDLNPDYVSRCWLKMGKRNDFLWLFIVPVGETYITKAYGRNMKTGAWMVRDFSHKWSTGGITAANLVGGQTHTIGETYAEAMETLSSYDADISTGTSGDITRRYGDVLIDTTGSALAWTSLDYTLDFTDIEFSEGGLFFCFSASADPTKLVGDDTDYSGLVLAMDDGSDSSNIVHGRHYYTLTDISSVDGGGGDYTVTVWLDPRDTTGNALADDSANVPGINAVGADCTATIYDPSSRSSGKQNIRQSCGRA